MHKPIVSLSFDDGRQDNYRVFKEILREYGLPATLNIATGYIEGKVQAALQPAMSIEQIIELNSSDLVEIACHGDLHRNDLEDIIRGRTKLLEWLGLPPSYMIGFASPGSEMNSKYIHENEDFFRKHGFEYMRIGLCIKSKSLFRKLSRRLARIINSKELFKLAYSESVQTTNCGMEVYSVPILKEISVEQIIGLVKFAEKKGGWCVLMFHSIQPLNSDFYDDNWTYDQQKFENLCQELVKLRDEGRIEVKTTVQAYLESY